MSTEIVLKNDAAKKLLPDSYKGKVNLSALAVEINSASNLGNTSLTKLKEVASGGWLSQTWNTTDINRCVHDSLVAISTLSKAQIALQAITAEINQATLSEQKIIAQQQQQLAFQQHELAAHSAKIEELIVLTDQSSFIEEVSSKIKTLQSQVSSIDPEKIVAWQLGIENNFDELNRLLGAELSKWLDNLTHQIQTLSDAIKIEENKSDRRYEKLLDEIEHTKVGLVNANIKNETHRKMISQLKTSMVALSFTQVCAIALILFFVMR